MNTATDTLQDQAPLYINGTLSAHQKDVFEKALKRNTALKKEYLEFYEIDNCFDQFVVPGTEQLDNLYPKILAVIENDVAMEDEDPEAIDDIEYYESTFKRVLSSPVFVWGLVGVQLLALLLVLVFVLPRLSSHNKEQEAQLSQQEPRGKKINVVFEDKIRQKQITHLLLQMNAQIVAGPSDIGLYTLRVMGSQHHIKAVLNQLRQSKLVVLAEPGF